MPILASARPIGQLTEALAAYITGPDYPAWPTDPLAPVVAAERARDEQGRFVADDPATSEVNEAWVSGSSSDALLGEDTLSLASGSTGAQVLP